MIGYLEADSILRAEGKRLFEARGRREEPCDLLKSVGRVLSRPLSCPEDIPSFRNSAMDGFAVRSEDTRNATPEHPLTLTVQGLIAAGDRLPAEVRKPSVCFEIMTGAPVPDGFDAIIKVEDVRVLETGEGRKIEIRHPAFPNDHIRKQGEDFRKGTRLLAAPTVLNPEHVMAFAALGLHCLPVLPDFRIALIPTGKELVDFRTPTLEPGLIRNSTSAYLSQIAPRMGASIDILPVAPDRPEEFKDTLDRMISEGRYDAVITTGAVSMGRFDFVSAALESLRAELLFHRVAIRPGRPFLFAKSGNLPFFGLPGNPISTAVGFRFFVEPLIRASNGLPPESPIRAQLTHPLQKPQELRCFWKAHLDLSEPMARVTALKEQASFIVSSLLRANVWVILPEGRSQFKAGEAVEVFPLLPAY